MKKLDFLEKIKQAKYSTRNDSMSKENAFLSSLPKISNNPVDIFKSFGNIVRFTDEDRALPPMERYENVCYLKDHFVALNSHFDISLDINALITSSYRNRRPGDFKYENKIQYLLDHMDRDLGDFIELPDCMTVFGPAGIGKSSIIQRKLKEFDAIGIIKDFKGEFFSQIYVPYLFIPVPDNATIKDFFEVFLERLAEKVGDPRINKLYEDNKAKGVPKLSDMLSKVCLTYGVGLVVLDEVQMLYSNNKQSTVELRDFLTRFLNNLYASVIFIGTDEAKDLLRNKVFLTRRLTSYKEGHIEKLKKDTADWNTFLASFFRNCQITNVITELTPELNDTIFELTDGFPYRVKQLLMNTQRTLIKRTVYDPGHKEYITPEVLRKVSKNDFKELNTIYTGIKNGDMGMIQQFSDAGIELKKEYSPKKKPVTDIKGLYAEFRRRVTELVYLKGYDEKLPGENISTIITRVQQGFTDPALIEEYIDLAIEQIGRQVESAERERKQRKEQNQCF